MHASLARSQHRPWPLPRRPWIGRQSWRDLLFAHWPLPAAALRPLLPEGLTLDVRDGQSWVGVVPFRMTGVAPRGLPDLPGLSAFLETNVRLYVTRDGKPGVWFLSLDAANRLAVWAARRFFHLPYFHARLSMTEHDGRIDYQLSRGAARLAARYAPTGPVFQATPTSLEHFLTERYCLYAARGDGTLLRTEVHHPPWPLQPASAEVDAGALLATHAIAVAGPPPLLHFSRRIDVVVWAPEPA